MLSPLSMYIKIYTFLFLFLHILFLNYIIIATCDLERQIEKSYGPYKFRQLFDLWVKGQGQMNVEIVCDIPSNGLESTYQTSFTNYLTLGLKLWPGQGINYKILTFHL